MISDSVAAETTYLYIWMYDYHLYICNARSVCLFVYVYVS